MPDAQMLKEKKTIEMPKAVEERSKSDIFLEKYGKQLEDAFIKGEVSARQITAFSLSLSAKYGPDVLKEAFAKAEALQHKADTTVSRIFEPLVFWGDYSKSKVEYGNDGVKVAFSNSLKSWAPEKVTFEATASGGSLTFDWKFGGPKVKKI
jgi:hypothetical protein